MDREINVRYIVLRQYIRNEVTRDTKVTGAIFPIFPLKQIWCFHDLIWRHNFWWTDFLSIDTKLIEKMNLLHTCSLQEYLGLSSAAVVVCELCRLWFLAALAFFLVLAVPLTTVDVFSTPKAWPSILPGSDACPKPPSRLSDMGPQIPPLATGFCGELASTLCEWLFHLPSCKIQIIKSKKSIKKKVTSPCSALQDWTRTKTESSNRKYLITS